MKIFYKNCVENISEDSGVLIQHQYHCHLYMRPLSGTTSADHVLRFILKPWWVITSFRLVIVFMFLTFVFVFVYFKLLLLHKPEYSINEISVCVR